MKIKMKSVALAAVMFLGGVTLVAAAPQRRIDASACETVYTNYYLFLDANTTSYFDKGVSNVYHSTAAAFTNNNYMISNFDMDNVGYGQVNISRNTSTSRDGITSMSLNDYYTLFNRASSNGTYTSGTSNYFTHSGWYSYDANGNEVYKTGGLDLSRHSKQELIGATLDANALFTLQSTISPRVINPIKIRIDRSYYGSLTNAPVAEGNYKWYLHPAVFYVQYCSPKSQEPEVPVKREYTVTYNGNGSNVINVPGTQKEVVGSCIYISNAPTREGYRFVGWSNRPEAVDQAWMPGDKYCGPNSLNLFAIWEKIQTPTPTPVDTYYTIRYNANTNDSVVGLPDPFTQNSNYDAYISTAVPTRNGWEFLGWNPDNRATTGDVNYKGGSTYSDRKDITLYAIWKKVGGNDTPNLPSNPNTGITDYLLPFGGVISASGLGLGLLKKKKSFKQF